MAENVLAFLEAATEHVKQYIRKGKKGPISVKEYSRQTDHPMHPQEINSIIHQKRQQMLQVTSRMYGIQPKQDPKFKVQGFGVHQKAIAQTWNQLSKNFSTVANALKGVRMKKLDKGTFADAGEGVITLNTLYADQNKFGEELAWGKKWGMYPPGFDKAGWSYLLAHEFGHELLNHVGDSKEADEWHAHWAKQGEKFWKKSLGTNASWDSHEAFADAFAQLVTLKRQHSSHKQLMKILDLARRTK